VSNRTRFELADPELNRQLEALLDGAEARFGAAGNREAVRQLVVAALRLVSDKADRGNARLLANAVKELRHAFRVFSECIVARGWMVITGAGDGIMGAAQLGAGRESSFGVNIRLPWEQHPNAVIAGDPKLINFRYFFTRKLAFLKEAHAIALFRGGFGTLDEGFEALTLIQTGRSEILPVVFVDVPGGRYWRDWRRWIDAHLRDRGLIDADDLALFRVTDDAEAAARDIADFYRNYHSSRFFDDVLVLRVRVAPDPEQLAALNREFGGLCTSGAIELEPPSPEDEEEAPGHARLALRFDRRKAGGLRLLIDRLNALAPDQASPREASPRALPEGDAPSE
jgi:uncharacterized protein (TIGR00730 family)